jgi:predicted nucleic acid-binding protein
MNGNKLLLDTNVVLSILGSKKVFSALEGKELFISFITELELFSYPALTKEEEKSITFFLSKVTILDINQGIKAKTIQLRKKYKLKLPDAIICATAASKNLTLVSNDKQFKKITAPPIVTLSQL